MRLLTRMSADCYRSTRHTTDYSAPRLYTIFDPNDAVSGTRSESLRDMSELNLEVSLLAALLIFSGGGCAEETVACEPLEARTAAVEIEEILAVGRAEDGTIVVVDRTDEDSSPVRLFVSDGDSLVLQPIAGSGTGSGADGTQSWSLGVSEADPPIRVLVQRRDGELHMKLYRSADALAHKGFDFAAAPGETLEILDHKAISTLTIRDLSSQVTVEYFARADADRLVVIRPDSGELVVKDVRLFFGAPDAMQEREVRSFMRYRDGGSTQIDFDIDGSEARVFFPSKLQTDGPTITEPVTFEVAGNARSIERAVPAEDPELLDLRFRCFE